MGSREAWTARVQHIGVIEMQTVSDALTGKIHSDMHKACFHVWDAGHTAVRLFEQDVTANAKARIIADILDVADDLNRLAKEIEDHA